ncbi:Outer membrane efflux protein [compost metagenome]
MPHSLRLSCAHTILASCLGLASIAPAAFAAEPATLSELGLQAEQANPEIAAARLRLEAVRVKAGYAGDLEAPKVSASVMDFASLGGPRLSLSQMLPGGSKRNLAAAIARGEARLAEAQYRQARLSVQSGLRQAFFEQLYLERALVINRQALEQLRNMRKIADAKYAVGAGLQVEPLRAQLELSKGLERGLSLEQQVVAGRARINALANRPANAAIQLPKDFPAIASVPDAATLLARAEAQSPALEAMAARTEVQRSALALAQQDKGVPDFDVGLEAGRSMPGDMVYLGGMVGINLPWLAPNRFDGRIREAEAGLAEAEAQVQAERNRLRYEVNDLRTRLHQVERQLHLYDQGVVPQATQALKASLAAYQVNKLDFNAVLESQLAIFEAQTAVARAKADQHQALAKLEALIGAPVGAPQAK